MNLSLRVVTLQNKTKMAYKKYIKRGKKTYGPYIYHSRRIDGKVISEYRGSEKLSYKKIFLAIFGLIFLATLIYIFIFSEKEITGKAVFDLDADYQQGIPLEGKLRLSLQEGELIPASSKLIFENDGNIFEYNLKDLLSEELNEGSFYIEEASISSSGEGYGFLGEREIFPTVYFVLSILSEEKPDAEQTGELETTEIQTENTTEDAPITGNVISKFAGAISNFFLDLGMTGKVVVEFERETNGQVSAGETFIYILYEGEKAEIKPRSVKTDSKQLSDNDVELKIEDNEVIVTTDYSEIGKGFGEDYLGSRNNEIIIDISNLDLILKPGSLKISLIDSNQEIISLSTLLREGEMDVNEIISKEPIQKVPETDLTPKIPETDLIQKVPETYLTPGIDYGMETEIYIPEVIIDLTEQERAILIEKFGNILKVKEATSKRKFIRIRYELSPEYWVEFNYAPNLSKEVLESFMDRDRTKWLMDVAKSLSEEPKTEGEPKESEIPI